MLITVRGLGFLSLHLSLIDPFLMEQLAIMENKIVYLVIFDIPIFVFCIVIAFVVFYVVEI